MGVVYKAHDTLLDRFVALKFLPAHVSVNEETKARFLQEARAAAALNHAQICTIHGIEEEGTQIFIVMEYIEGGTLREKIPFAKVNDALSLAIQIGEALREAHAKGIVHRDIKADNIMLTSNGQAKVMDFGLAKLKGSLKLTKTSSTVGTLAYMAPEQIQGGDVDARSDIFSFGVVLFEMLIGHMPFRGEHEAAMMYSILNEQPASLLTLRPDFPAELDRIVQRSLEKDPEDRYQHVDDMVSELRKVQKQSARVTRPTSGEGPASSSGGRIPETRTIDQGLPESKTAGRPPGRTRLFIGLGVIVVVLAAGSIAYMAFFGRQQSIDSIAVLPFVNVRADSTIEYLSDGITENLINSLTQLSNLRVIPRSTAFHYKGRDVDPREVGNTLKVRSLLTGRVIQHGDELNIQLDLIDIATESQIWGAQYNRKLSDIAAVQQEIVRGVSQRLQPGLSGEEKTKMARGRTENAEAFQLYMQGRFYWNKRTPESLNASIGYFERAIEKDPGYALAYAGLADAYIVLSSRQVYPPTETFPRARTAALKALEINNELAEAHASLAGIIGEFDWDWSGAEREFKRSIELNPNYPTGHQWYAEYLSQLGRHQEALAEIRKAKELDPLSLIINTIVGWVYINNRQFDLGIEQCRRVFEMDSSFSPAQTQFINACVRKGMNDEELDEVNRVQAMQGVSRADIEAFNRAYKSDGLKGLARLRLTRLDATAKDKYTATSLYASNYAIIGEKERALQALEKCLEERDRGLVFLKTSPAYDGLRSEPRFIAILKKVGLDK